MSMIELDTLEPIGYSARGTDQARLGEVAHIERQNKILITAIVTFITLATLYVVYHSLNRKEEE